jgi:hypothetical protein
MGVPKGGSPLYNSRPYSPPAPNGLPKALDDVGIDQKLDEQLPLDLEFRNESGEAVKPAKGLTPHATFFEGEFKSSRL